MLGWCITAVTKGTSWKSTNVKIHSDHDDYLVGVSKGLKLEKFTIDD